MSAERLDELVSKAACPGVLSRKLLETAGLPFTTRPFGVWQPVPRARGERESARGE